MYLQCELYLQFKLYLLLLTTQLSYLCNALFVSHGNPGDYVWGAGGLDAIITQLLNNVEGAGPPPADADKIEKLPTVKITQDQVGRFADC